MFQGGEGKKVRKCALGLALTAVLVFGVAQFARADGPAGRGSFSHRGGHGRPNAGLRSCIATSSSPCPEYQFTFTITNVEPVLVGGSASTITNTTTGIIAGDMYGSTYRDVKLAGIGRWASQGGSAEFVYIKNLDPSVMMDFIVNATKGTYEEFAIHPRTASANWQGKGPHNGGGSGARPTPTPITNYIISDGTYTCPTAEQTSITHTVQLPGVSGTTTITTNQVYCPALKIVVEEDHNDPRFGTRMYLLSDYINPPQVSFTAPSGDKLVQKKAWHGGDPRSGNHQLPSQH